MTFCRLVVFPVRYTIALRIALRSIAPFGRSLLAGCLILSATVGAQHAPLPDALVAAKSIFLINDSSDLKAYDAFFAELTKWKHFAIVMSRDKADIIALLTTNAAYAVTVGSGSASTIGGTTMATGTAFSIPANYLGLKIFDAKTADVLWTDATEKRIGAARAPGQLVNHLRDRFPQGKSN
jgi:hypothetical protein